MSRVVVLTSLCMAHRTVVLDRCGAHPRALWRITPTVDVRGDPIAPQNTRRLTYFFGFALKSATSERSSVTSESLFRYSRGSFTSNPIDPCPWLIFPMTE